VNGEEGWIVTLRFTMVGPRRQEDTTGHDVFIRWRSCCLNYGGMKVLRRRWWRIVTLRFTMVEPRNHGGTKTQRGTTFSFAGAHVV